jgi:hypothetical protein
MPRLLDGWSYVASDRDSEPFCEFAQAELGEQDQQGPE